MAYGTDIKKGVEFNGVNIYDITPTILHIFDLPIPDDMDGEVVREIYEPNSKMAFREIRYTNATSHRGTERKTISAEEEEEIQKRLKKLGYI